MASAQDRRCAKAAHQHTQNSIVKQSRYLACYCSQHSSALLDRRMHPHAEPAAAMLLLLSSLERTHLEAGIS